MHPRIRVFLIFFAPLIVLTSGCFLLPPPHSDYRPIHEYSLACDAQTVQTILRTNSAAVNLPDDSRRTPLHAAASRNCTNVIALLLHSGARLEARDQAGETPVHVAAQEGFIDAARMLLEAGARINARDNDGHTPLRRAIDFEKPAMAEFLRNLGGTE
jgi:ankyrin repeat protein